MRLRRAARDLAQLLAIGHECAHSESPAVAYWLAEIAFSRRGLFGVYALAQLCVIYLWACSRSPRHRRFRRTRDACC